MIEFLIVYGVETKQGILYSAPHPKRGKMPNHSIPQNEYLKAAQHFHWATKDHYNIWLFGTTERSRRTESILPRLAKKWANRKTRKYSLFATRFGKRMVYTCPRRVRNPNILHKIPHGLGVTECLVRLKRACVEAQVIDERQFYGCGIVPDVGFLIAGKTILLIEYCSKSNFEHCNVIKNKLSAYQRHLWEIEQKFSAKPIVVFVIDISKDINERFVSSLLPCGPQFFFTDFETFKEVPLGSQLIAPIYIWGEDGSKGPLTHV